jgi:nitrile hydratase accessory protein
LHDDGSALFEEPWQAEALALADTLVKAGAVTPSSWSAALGAALRQAEAAGKRDTPATYYTAVVDALEELLEASGAVSHDALAERQEAWREAYRTTPHGRPVALRRG